MPKETQSAQREKVSNLSLKFTSDALARLRKRHFEYCEKILAGEFVTLEDYKHVAGKAKGIKEAEDILIELCEESCGVNMETKGVLYGSKF
jgi:hypothetical protein